MRTCFLPAVLAAAAAGCADRPRAPALTDDAVYADGRAGLRFVVPEGWVMGMRTVPPPGPLDKPVQLVRYQSPNPAKAADLELLAVDLPAGDDVGKYLAEHLAGGRKWAAGPVQPLTVNGAAATRYEYTAAGSHPMRREVTAFRRGGRVYLFTTTFGAGDTDVRDQSRRAVESVVWAGP